MSYEEIAREALERAEKATEGWELRWEEEPGEYGTVLGSWPYFEGLEGLAIEDAPVADLEFIAFSRDALPDLARAVLELAKLQETMEGQQKRNRQLAHELSAALDVCEAVDGLYKPLPEGAKTLSDLEAVGRAYRKWASGARSST